jgi:N-acetylglucosaminyl-diphospho-decaprenol L-rhamnosyltransferase
MSSTYVIVVNYRTGRLVIDCLASLAPEVPALKGGRVVVVDNASGDDSLPVISAAIAERGWSGWVELIALPRNGGFAYGNNAAIRRVRELDSRFAAVVLLNPDTVAREGAIERLVSFLGDHPEAGIVGASIENERGSEEPCAHAYPSPLIEFVAAANLDPLTRWLRRRHMKGTGPGARRCDWVSGACMAIRRETLDAVGPMDENFFLYFEEVDFCARAGRLGWTCWSLPQARVVHFEGASTGIKAGRRRRPAYWYDSRRRFFAKQYGIAGLLAADLLWGTGRLSLAIRRALNLGGRGGIDSEPERIVSDLLGGDLRALVRGELFRGFRSLPD